MKYKVLNFARQLALILLVIWTVVSLVTLLIELVPGDGYGLTYLGRELNESFQPLHRFAERWSRQTRA